MGKILKKIGKLPKIIIKMKNLNHLLAIKEIKSAVRSFHTKLHSLTVEVWPKGVVLALNMIPRTEKEREKEAEREKGKKGRREEEGLHG